MNNRNTIIYVKVKGKRPPGFKDPEPFEWNEEKDRQLWKFISKLDSSIDQIDWSNLSTVMNAPTYFLRKRSHKLFDKHMSQMKRQLNINKNIHPIDTLENTPIKDQIHNLETDTSKIITENQNSKDEIYTLKEQITSPKRRILTAMNSFKESPVNSVGRNMDRNQNLDNYLNANVQMSELTINSKGKDADDESLVSDSIKEALEQLHTSKILETDPTKKSSEKGSDSGTRNNEDYDSDLSYSLSVSKSALEEALLDRLHF